MSGPVPPGRPSDPRAGETDVDALADYLRTNAERHTREALDARLRAAGHTDAVIAQAWARVRSAAGVPPSAPPGALATYLVILAIVLMVAVFGISALLAVAGTMFAGQDGFRSGVLIVYLVGLISGMVIAARLFARTRRPGRGVRHVLGAAAVVALIYLGLSGACIATINAGPA